MKKLIVFLLALCMVFALCACGSKPTEETSPAEEAALVEDTVKPVTIRFATNKLHFTELSGRHSVLERPLSEVNGRLFFS